MNNDIEQARELLAAELRKDGSPVVAQYVLDGHDDGCTAMRAIAAALRAAPEGFTLVPIEPTESMVDAFNRKDSLPYNPRSQKEFKAKHCYAAMIAAAPTATIATVTPPTDLRTKLGDA